MRLNLAIIPAPHEGAFGDEVTDSDHAEPHGVCLTRHAGEAPEAHKPCAISTTLADGRVLESDLVMLSIGVAPESTLARPQGSHNRACTGQSTSAPHVPARPHAF